MRLRLRFAKVGKVRFTSHRDVARIVERALRRADLPVAFTEGFSPRPKLHFGLALPTAYESLGEFIEVDLRPDDAADVDLDTLPARLSDLLPPGMVVTDAGAVDRSGPSLQQAVVACSWWVAVVGQDEAALAASLDDLLARPEVMVTRERKGKQVTDDIRPSIERVAVVPDAPALPLPAVVAADLGEDAVVPPAGAAVVEMVLAAQPRAVRPAEVLAVVDPALEERRVVRQSQWMVLDGARHELGSAAATRAVLAEVRAS